MLFYRIFLLIFTLEKATSDIRKGVKSKYISTLFLFKFRVANRQKNKPKNNRGKKKKKKGNKATIIKNKNFQKGEEITVSIGTEKFGAMSKS